MNLLCNLWRSSLGKKYLMAISGSCLFLFVLGHMIGNLQFFLGPETLNRYAHFLQSNLELLWPVRIFLLTMLGVHVVSAIRLWRDNRAARPQDYAHGQAPLDASLASRMMVLGGLVVGVFLVYHLLHYTVKVEAINRTCVNFNALNDDAGHPDVYAMVVIGFSNKLVSLFYALGVGLLCLHLSHGVAAMFQSLGLKNRTWGPVIDQLARVLAIGLLAGYLAVPFAVVCGSGQDYAREAKARAKAACAVCATCIAQEETR